MNTRLWAAFLIVVLSVALAPGQTPLGTAFTYQGRLETAAGPVNGVHDLRFLLYDVPTGGAPLGAPQCFDNMNVAEGLVTLSLDFGATQFTGQERFLEIEVRADNPRDCTNSSGFIALVPRQPLSATPYALQTRGLFVDNAGRVAIGTTTPVNQLTINGGLTLRDVSDDDVVFYTGDFHINNGDNDELGYHYQSNPEQHEFFIEGGLTMRIAPDGNVGIGINAATPGARLHVQSGSNTGIGVYGQATGGSAVNFGVSGQSASTQGRGVTGVASAINGTTYGGYFESASTTGRGVYGDATATDGINYGGRFHSASGNGRGVYGEATAASGETYGGRFHSASPDGTGVYGAASAASGAPNGVHGECVSDSFPAAGVRGDASGTNGTGVVGMNSSATGFAYGVFGKSLSTGGTGVVGSADSPTGAAYGVWGRTDSVSGRGVFGQAMADTGNGAGVVGSTHIAAGGYAVYAFGDMGASGVKPFRIDHPDDPANKYLLHYAAESPMPQNFYVGNVVTDAKGYAWVELPDYFAEINQNFKYQLTVVDDADSDGFVMAKISKEIRENRFQVRTSAPNVKVSWRVDADRNDLYVRHKQPKDVVEKLDPERGKYQHPELYGQPPEKGMNYDARRAERESASPPAVSEPTPR